MCSKIILALSAMCAAINSVAATPEEPSISSPEADASNRAAAVWEAELKGDRVAERELAMSMAEAKSPDWAAPWARGVLNRLGSDGRTIEVKFTAVDGKVCDIGKLRGKVVMVVFWATWCAPCVEGTPKLKELYDKHKSALEVIGISWDSDTTALTKYIRAQRIEWPIYCDGTKPGKWGMSFGIGGVPYVMLLDKNGVLRYSGADEAIAIDIEVPKLLREL